jgi:DNA mismatch repair protein MutS
LFRVGDFYETFGEDAINASRILGITLPKGITALRIPRIGWFPPSRFRHLPPQTG